MSSDRPVRSALRQRVVDVLDLLWMVLLILPAASSTSSSQPWDVDANLLFTPDRGDNLYDDTRRLYGHALRHPTRWDVRVPAIFWANDAWRAAHPRQWVLLQAQASSPLMHADMVPTFLAAAGVAYEEPRPQAVDLLDARVPPRHRTIQRALGAVVDWDTLVREADEAGAGSASSH